MVTVWGDDTLISLTLLITSLCICLLNHHAVYLKYMQFYFKNVKKGHEDFITQCA